MTDLSTTYMGLNLRSPLVPSASPLSEDIDNIKRMEDAGAAAVVMHSLFEEQGNWQLVAIRKTIDNDVALTERVIGFDTAINTVTDALNRLTFTAASHDRVMVVEVIDRLTAAAFGKAAVDLLAQGESGKMVAWQSEQVEAVQIEDVVAHSPLPVNPNRALVQTARALAIYVGDCRS
jgi:6-phosphofructokinase